MKPLYQRGEFTMNAANSELGAKKPRGRSLSLIIDAWVGSSFVIAMGVCAAVEYLRDPDAPIGNLLSHHLLELFLFGALLWGISWLVLRTVLIAPVKQIFQHLYRIGDGDHAPLTIKTHVREIRDIADAINIMVWRMDRHVDRGAISKAEHTVARIWECLHTSEIVDAEAMATLTREVADLENTLRELDSPG